MTTPLLTAEQVAEVMLLADDWKMSVGRQGPTADNARRAAIESHLLSLTHPVPDDYTSPPPKLAFTVKAAYIHTGKLKPRRLDLDEDAALPTPCLPAAPVHPEPFDHEAMIRAVLPGGHSCDPQAVADDIREWVRAHAVPARAREIAAQQAEDDGLWFKAESASEAYLQQELRRLTAAVEAHAAPSREPLTQAQIVYGISQLPVRSDEYQPFKFGVRFAERAHGIGAAALA